MCQKNERILPILQNNNNEGSIAFVIEKLRVRATISASLIVQVNDNFFRNVRVNIDTGS